MFNKIVALIVLLAAVGTMAYSGNQLAATEAIYQAGNAAYDSLGDAVKSYGASGHGAAQAQTEGQPAGGADGLGFEIDFEIDFDALAMSNSDAVAWLHCPGTAIDYPVMQAEDYDYYLHHLPDGTQNANGSLFIDFNNASDFSERLTVIYGHNMKSKKMFGSLGEYKNQKHYDAHPSMYLLTPRGNYRADLLYGCVIGAGQWRERAFMYKENVNALLAYAAYNTTFESGAAYADGDRLVVMSTCSYEFDDARYLVIGVLRDME
jgi:sortase B